MFQYLGKNGFTNQDFVEMGAYSVVENSKTKLGNLVSDLKTPAQIYEKLVYEYQAFFEQNCDYGIESLGKTGCVMSYRWKPELIESLKTEKIGSVETCFTKMGIFTSVPGFLGLPKASVKKIACVYAGDPSCLYQIDYSKAYHEASSGLFN